MSFDRSNSWIEQYGLTSCSLMRRRKVNALGSNSMIKTYILTLVIKVHEGSTITSTPLHAQFFDRVVRAKLILSQLQILLLLCLNMNRDQILRFYGYL